MVREAAQKADAADIEELDRLLEEQTAVVGDAEAFVAADRRFHGKIAAISRNAIFDAVAEAMAGWLHDHQAGPAASLTQRRLTLQEHGAIVKCIKARDADGAEAALLRYLDRWDA